jgi:hypothetical protein
MSKIEIFLVVLFVLLSLISSAVKKKKKVATAKYPPASEPEEWDEEIVRQDVFESYDTASRQKTENFSENGNYFTYETAANHYDSTSQYKDKILAKKQPEAVQIVENEEEKSREFDFSTEELYKGIIYSEILQRPDYL